MLAVDPGADVKTVDCAIAGPNGLVIVPTDCSATGVTFTIPAGGWDGGYVVTVTVTDHANNSTSASATYTLTQVAPKVTAPAPSTARTVTVAVAPGADVKTFSCSVARPNGLVITPTSCTSTAATFTIPAGGWDGGYLVTVTVTDHANNSLSDSATYTLTQVAPQVTAPAPSTARDVTVGLDPGADVKTVACTVAGPNGLVIVPTDCSATGVTFTIPAGGWDGGYVVTVTVTDHANNSTSASATYTLTQVAPKVTAPAPSTARTVTVAVAPGADVKTFPSSVPGPNGLVITPTSCTSTAVTFTIPAGGWDGGYLVTVTITDHANNSLADSATYTLTQVAPQVTAPAPSTARDVTVGLDPGADVKTVACAVAGPNGLVIVPTDCFASGVTFTIPAGGWDGGYLVTVTVTDHANNSLSDSATYTLTQVAPTVTAPAPSTARTVTVAVAPGADVKTVACTVVGPNLAVTPTSCTGSGVTFTIPASGYDGDYVVMVTVTDHANNSLSDSASYTLTQVAPKVTAPAPSTARTVTVAVAP